MVSDVGKFKPFWLKTPSDGAVHPSLPVARARALSCRMPLGEGKPGARSVHFSTYWGLTQ